MKPKLNTTEFLAGVVFNLAAAAITVGLSAFVNSLLGVPWSPESFWRAMAIGCLLIFGSRIGGLWRAWK